MTVSDLIKMLEKEKKQYGDINIIFSSDEEGNLFHADCFTEFNNFDSNENAIALYPCGTLL